MVERDLALLSYKHNNFRFLFVETTSLNTFSREKQSSSVFFSFFLFFRGSGLQTRDNASVASFNTRLLEREIRNSNDGTKQIDHPSAIMQFESEPINLPIKVIYVLLFPVNLEGASTGDQ